MSSSTLTNLLGIRYPILQGGMTWVGRHALATAITESGALGVIGSGGMDAEELRTEIRMLRGRTAGVYGVNISLVPVRPDGEVSVTDELIRVVLEEEVPVVITGGGSPKRYTEVLKRGGATVLHVVPSVVLAQKSQDAGVDAIVAESSEAGGHIRVDGLSTFSLVPQVVDAVEVPVVAAGGIADARGALAAIALGAAGVQIGTRFIATFECNAHAEYKRALIDSPSEGSLVYCRSHHASRGLATAVVRRLVQMEQAGATPEELAAKRGKSRARAGCLDGAVEHGLLPAGAAVGLVRELCSARDVVSEIMGGMRALLDGFEGADAA